MKEFFKPEDFKDFFSRDDNTSAELVSEVANEKLNALIESWPTVYSPTQQPSSYWSQARNSHSRHTAMLAFIKETTLEPCKHEPKLHIDDEVDIIALLPKCKHCGVELQATWSAK